MRGRTYDYLRGYVRIRISGTSYDRFLNLCAYHGVKLWELCPYQEAYEANLSIRDFRRLRAIVRKSHTRIVIVGRQGLPFFIHRYRKRKWYLISIAAACVFLFWLSGHIWSITVDGNLSQSDDVIFEYLNTRQIVYGMPKSQVDCHALAAQIRNDFPDFSWVAAQLEGTQLQIHVKEGILDEEEEQAETPSSLSASAGGVVVSMIVRSGTPLVSIGDTVEQGQVLVSGVLPIYGDDAELMTCQYVAADADILLERTYPYRDTLLLTGTQKQYTGEEKVRWSLQAGGQSFAFFSSLGGFETYDVVTELRQLQLSEHFYLPVFLRKYTVRAYEMQRVTYTQKQAETILNSNFQYFAKKLQEKGVQIFENNVKIKWNEKSAIASGSLTVREEAVRRVPVEDTEEELLKYEYG
jgi:similar to stage IV sporulation protein